MARGRKTGGGSRKGIPNRVTQAAREALGLAFQGIGGVEALTTWGRENRTEFYKIYARLIPVEQHISGADGAPLKVLWPLAKSALDR